MIRSEWGRSEGYKYDRKIQIFTALNLGGKILKAYAILERNSTWSIGLKVPGSILVGTWCGKPNNV